MTQSFLSHLKERGLVAQISHEEELGELLARGVTNANGQRYAAYCGFDPTAKSLHVGNLVQLMGLRRAQDFGLTPIILFGGATGLIGDPTGRTELRQMNSREQINSFIENFKILVRPYFNFDVANAPVFVNNIDWLGGMSWIDFLRDVGMHFTVARLLAAEVNKSRFENGGLTFMELGYQLLQAYDFSHLAKSHNCILQIGGNDQWSNILAGADLIRRTGGGNDSTGVGASASSVHKAFALTLPLLVGSDGRKYGKSAGNAIWLDGTMTSPYEFYQFFRNTHDDDVGLLLRIFTFVPESEIVKIANKAETDINKSKDFLAFEITKMVHGAEQAQKAQEAAKALFSGHGDLSNAPFTNVSKSEIEAGLDFLNLLVKTGLSASRGEARKLIQGNGLVVNDVKHTDIAAVVRLQDFETENQAMVLRKGKKDFHLVKLAP